jgi:GntR family transcriptional regulator/MocR family aminotransferase
MSRGALTIPLTLDRKGAETLQRQIYGQIRDGILSGRLAPGFCLPSSRELADAFGLSRNTVVLAYEWLSNEGYLDLRRRSGTFVTDSLPERSLSVAPSSHDVASPAGPVSAKRHRLIFRGQRLQMVERGSGPPDIKFWYGSANWRHFPLGTWRRLLIENLSRMSANLSEYGPPGGNMELRKAIAEHIGAARGVRARPEQVIVTAGAQEGMDLICRLLVAAGTPVVVENPCYAGCVKILQGFGADLIPVNVDNLGLDTDALDKTSAAVAYVTPSHQFPTGATLPLERRLRLLQWAERVGAYIIEDDYDSDFRYDGPPIAALAGLDRGGCVIYVGTFSKSIGAGLRTGFIVVPDDLVEPITAAKSLSNYGHPWLEQIVLADFLRSGAFNLHLRRIRQQYRHARDVLVSALNREFGNQRLSGHEAGMHMMWTLPDDFPDAHTLSQRASQTGVGIYPLAQAGAVSFSWPQEHRAIVLGYSLLTPEQIETGVKRLAAAVATPADKPAANLSRRPRAAGA